MSKDAQSVTVKLSDGSTKIVFYSASTTVSKSATGTAADLTAGTGVIVTGTTNPDGSVTADAHSAARAGRACLQRRWPPRRRRRAADHCRAVTGVAPPATAGP